MGHWGAHPDPLLLPETKSLNQRKGQSPESPGLFLWPGGTPIPSPGASPRPGGHWGVQVEAEAAFALPSATLCPLAADEAKPHALEIPRGEHVLRWLF